MGQLFRSRPRRLGNKRWACLKLGKVIKTTFISVRKELNDDRNLHAILGCAGKLGLVFLGAVLISAPALARPGVAHEKPLDCSTEFGFELNPKLDLFDLKVLGRPIEYNRDGYYLSVQSFDTDFQPERKGGMGGMAILSAGGLELSDAIAGGMVLAKEAAYFDDEMSKALNKRNGKLNAVFLISLNDDKCGGKSFVISFDKTGLLTLDGKKLAKVDVSPLD